MVKGNLIKNSDSKQKVLGLKIFVKKTKFIFP